MTLAARRLKYARRRAGLTQRALATKAGVPQSTVARIELGVVDPRVNTFERLLRGCGMQIEVEPLLGKGVNRTQIRQLLKLTPGERIERMVEAGNAALSRNADRAAGHGDHLAELEVLGALRDEIEGRPEG